LDVDLRAPEEMGGSSLPYLIPVIAIRVLLAGGGFPRARARGSVGTINALRRDQFRGVPAR
jgi:hypothetical protein